MDGVAAVIQLMLAHADLAALVPADSVMAGPHPIGAELPCISVRMVTPRYRNPVKAGAGRFVEQRIQVTVQAADYSSQKAIIRQVVDAGDARFPEVDGIENVTVHLHDGGAELHSEEASLWIETQDFWVTYSEAR